MQTVNHPHGNHMTPSGGRLFVHDPGGHTPRNENGGRIPGGTSPDHVKVTKGTV